MPPKDVEDEHYIEGAHGTLAEQKDEAFYDDRPDASDDIEKGRLKFPDQLYGRDSELRILHQIYDEIISFTDKRGTSNPGAAKIKANVDGEDTEDQEMAESTDPYDGSCVVFLSGYSGVGKSALINEFVRQIHTKYETDESPALLYASGKYTEKAAASAPFSAICEVLGRLAENLSSSNDLFTKSIQRKIRASELIAPGTEGNHILQSTFPALAPLLNTRSRRKSILELHPTMNAIKECTKELLSVICGAPTRPLILFLDDTQWGDPASMEMILFLLSCSKLRNIMFICAYRSNEVDADHKFTKLMEDAIRSRAGGKWEKDNATLPESVARMDLFSLSPEAVSKFIADSVKKDDAKGVGELAQAVYQKTMGNIFFTKQALEELVRKNILFYDVMCFEWRWVVSKVELGNYISDDVVETVKGKIKELSSDIQHLLVVMAYIPKALDEQKLMTLVNFGEFSFEAMSLRDLLTEASEEGMILFSSNSNTYQLAHDRIRQASLEYAAETDQDALLLHISSVLQGFADKEPATDWCLYVAVDILNSQPGKTDINDLIKLNLEVAKIARTKGCLWKENEFLHKGLNHLESTVQWREYDLTLDLYNALIISDCKLGSYSNAKLAIKEVLQSARSIDDKIQAYLHQLMCKSDETKDYSEAMIDGVKILNLYGFEIPTKLTKIYMIMEEAKIKLALRNRSFSHLTKLPLTNEYIFELVMIVQKYTSWSTHESKANLIKILCWKSIRYAMMRGVGRRLPIVIVFYAASLAVQENVKAAQDLGNLSIALCDKIPDDKETCAITQMKAYGNIMSQLQPFSSSVDPLLKCHADLKLSGGMAEETLGSIMFYSDSYFAAGLELGPLLESKLLQVEELCQSLGRPGFKHCIAIYRQFTLNLRLSTQNPSEFQGKAFHEEEAMNGMAPNARRMALRDSSSYRLQLAFIFRDCDVMAQMLGRLHDYPLSDHMVARLHNRLCFTGLAAFDLCQRKESQSFSKLGKACLKYFARFTKLGSVNAKPVYLFMLAMKSPSREAFQKAINACAETSMIHLEAMAKERFAIMLNGESETALANDYITSSYWLYKDWGANAKALQLSESYSFLKYSQRMQKSMTLTTGLSVKSG